MKIGIDAGGTLIKIAFMKKDIIEFKSLSASKIDYVVSWINSLDNTEICVTGGRTAQVKMNINKRVLEVVEFVATIKGANYLLQDKALLLESYILANVVTGTSIHHVHNNRHERIGGTGVGGGTIMGLSQLMTGLSEYEEIVSLAGSGTRERIDLKVSHIYEGAEPPIPGDLTASNFGKLFHNAPIGGLTKEELLSSVVGLVGETVATVSVLAAGQCGVSSIVYIGSSFIKNDPLKEVIQNYTNLRGAFPIFLEDGEYCGAIGALFSLR